MIKGFRYFILKNFRSFFRIEPIIRSVIMSELCLQLINVSLLSIQLIYMQKEGYSDQDSAGFIAFRFLGVMLFAVPLGIYIRKHRIFPLFRFAAWWVPLMALLIIFAAETHRLILLTLTHFLWGVGFTLIQTPVLPFILRHSAPANQTSAIALSYSTYSLGGIISGVFIFMLNSLSPVLFNERNILIIITTLAFAGIFFLPSRFEEKKNDSLKSVEKAEYDWGIIIRALVPTLIIAVGAGLTIPFIGIFFFNVHHLSTGDFSFWTALASVLVAISAFMVPVVKLRIGYKIAIPLTQSIAILALVCLATTEFYSSLKVAAAIAVICFIIRQPLMNMAGPMTSELVMSYCGARNREMVSALTAAIWSGSWFISSLIFKILREQNWPYVYIFLITAFLYSVGVVWYSWLIADYNRREKKGLIEAS